MVVRVLGPGQHFIVYNSVLLGLSFWPKQKAKLDQASQYQAQVNDQHSQQPRGERSEVVKKTLFLQKQFFSTKSKHLWGGVRQSNVAVHMENYFPIKYNARDSGRERAREFWVRKLLFRSFSGPACVSCSLGAGLRRVSRRRWFCPKTADLIFVIFFSTNVLFGLNFSPHESA